MNLRTAVGGLLQRVQFVVRRVNAAQTANPLEIQAQDGTVLAYITPNGSVHGASLAMSADIVLSGDITPAAIGAAQNDYAPTGHATAAVFRLSSSADYDITGLAGGADGRAVIIYNVGANKLTLKDENIGSAAGNRFALPADLVLDVDNACILQYDATSTRWRLLGSSAAGGGGTPGGIDKNVQYNNAGAFGGVANNGTATKKYLQQVSAGAPSFQQVDHTDLSGIDTDISGSSIHHTIGGAGTQAAAGNHTHGGGGATGYDAQQALMNLLGWF